jgi:hypothetical protein
VYLLEKVASEVQRLEQTQAREHERPLDQELRQLLERAEALAQLAKTLKKPQKPAIWELQ